MYESQIKDDSEENASFLPLKMTKLTAELKQKARDELNETEENIRHGFQVLRNFIEKEKLPVPKDDYFLLTFLRGRKYRMKDVQQTLRRYVSLQEDFFEAASTDFDKIKKVLERKLVGILPYRDEEGRVIIFVRAGIWTPEMSDIEDGRKCLQLILHFAMQFPPTSVSGVRFFLDAGLKSARELPPYVKVSSHLLPQLRAFPARVQKVDFINEMSMVRIVYNTLKVLIPKKIHHRVQMHGASKESLYASLHPSILPSEFWGTSPSISCDSYVDEFRECVEKLKADISALQSTNDAP